MSPKTWLLAGATAISALFSAAGASANLLTNGSFETGSFVDNNGGQDTDTLGVGSTSMTGWTVSGSEALAWIGPTNPFSLTASDGSYFLDLTGYAEGAPFSGVTQTISTTDGAHYSLTFDLGSSANYGLPSGITASAGGTSQVFTSTSVLDSVWTTETLNFTASGASTVISLVGEQGVDYIGLDNVDVVETSGPIPEPAAWAIMMSGLFGVGALARRRRAISASDASLAGA